MLEALRERTVIIGNSGVGKSTLAADLAALVHVPAIDLDDLFWEGDGYERKRDEQTVLQMAHERAAQPRWIIEGVYGWVAEITPRATALIWLDFPWSLCRAGIVARFARRGVTDAK